MLFFYETYFDDLKERDEHVIGQETNDPMRYHCDDPGQIGIEKNLIDQEEQRQSQEQVEHEILRRSTRERKTPAYLEDYHHQIMATPCNKTLRNNDKALYPLNSVISYRKLSERQLKYTLSISTQTES